MAQHTDNQLPVGITEERVLKAAEDVLADIHKAVTVGDCLLCSSGTLQEDRRLGVRATLTTLDVHILASYAKAMLG